METPPPVTPIKRRLTAILAADAVGYSRQMGADEEGTLRVLTAHRVVIDRIIAAHDGRIVGTAGDSVLAEFASSVAAVRCAVEMQEALQTRNESLPESERLVFRVGVNLGDVMVDGDNILGDGVNVAARLESIAEPGGICISSSVYDQVAGKLSLGFLDIGEQSLKNISRPIRVYRFDRSGAPGTVRRAPERSRTLPRLALAGVAVAALASIGAWQAGLFRSAKPVPAAAPAAVAPTPVAPASAPANEPSEETRMKLQIAEAERAKAEAELAKARAEAEAARIRAQSARSAPADAKPVSAPAAATPAPAAPAPAPAAAASPAPAASAAVPSAPSTATASAARPDALEATGNCGPSDEMQPFSGDVPARMVGGVIVLERGTPNNPGYFNLRGRPAGDGTLALKGNLVPFLARAKGNAVPVSFEGAYANGRYTLTGQAGRRHCTIVLRAPAPSPN